MKLNQSKLKLKNKKKKIISLWVIFKYILSLISPSKLLKFLKKLITSKSLINYYKKFPLWLSGNLSSQILIVSRQFLLAPSS